MKRRSCGTCELRKSTKKEFSGANDRAASHCDGLRELPALLADGSELSGGAARRRWRGRRRRSRRGGGPS